MPTASYQFELKDKEFRDRLRYIVQNGKREAARALNEVGDYQGLRVSQSAPGGARRQLGRSVWVDRAKAGNLVVTIGSPHPGAAIHSRGDDIYPGSNYPDTVRQRLNPGKKPKYLWIPFPDTRGMRARDFAGKGTFVATLKDGRKFIAQRTMATGQGRRRGFFRKGKFDKGLGKKGMTTGGIRFLARLVENVYIKATHYFEWKPQDVEHARGVLSRSIGFLMTGKRS